VTIDDNTWLTGKDVGLQESEAFPGPKGGGSVPRRLAFEVGGQLSIKVTLVSELSRGASIQVTPGSSREGSFPSPS
jgi:hypothetical protein